MSFETLNPTTNENIPVNTNPSTRILDADEYLKQPNTDLVLPKTPVVCKPFEDAFQKVFEIAKMNPQRTVRSLVLLPGNCVYGRLLY